MMRPLIAVLLAAPSAAGYRRGYRRSPRVLGEELEVVQLTAEQIAAAPSSIDWSTKGGTSAITDQGDCGSCWAFSTMETVESAVFMSSGSLPPPLSVQQLVACDKGADGGCDGGDPVTGVKYLVKAGGMDSAKDYPDTSSKSGKTGSCKWSKKTVVTVQGSKFAVPECDRGTCKTDEDKLAAAVATHGPLSISINSGDQQSCDWMKYKSGVQKTSCSAKANLIDHSVQLVGYDKGASPPYWKVRNSWGKSWGEKGFIRLAMGVNSACIGCEALIITAKSKNPTPPAPPAPKNRFHCDTSAQECVKATDGHSTLALCQAACGAPSPPTPPQPVPPTPGCPGGSLQACIDACPASPPSVYQTCIKTCADRCPVPTPPAPVPPTPPSPPTPTSGVRQTGCTNSACTAGCASITFAIGECVRLQGGGSAKAVSCAESKNTPGRIGMQSHYWTSNDCGGTYDDHDWNDNDACYKEDQVTDGRVGTPDKYVKFECLGAANATAPADVPAGTRRSDRPRLRVLA